MNKAQWLEYARNEIRKAEKRMNIEFDGNESEHEMEFARDIIAAETQYISFLLSGIKLLGCTEVQSFVEELAGNRLAVFQFN